MSWEKLQNYNHFRQLTHDALRVAGWVGTFYYPSRIDNIGYENINVNDETQYQIGGGIENHYSAIEIKMFIDWNPTRSAFYRFNLNPDADENKGLILVHMDTYYCVKEECWIRTSGKASTGPAGDIFLKIVNILDQGKFRTLERQFLCRPVSDLQTRNILSGVNVEPNCLAFALTCPYYQSCPRGASANG